MLVAIIPLIVALVGLLMYVLGGANAKVVELGRLMFACGVLVSVWLTASHTLRIG